MHKLYFLLLFSVTFLATNTAFSQNIPSSMFANSVEWKTSLAHDELLKHVPSWQNKTLKHLFKYFKTNLYQKSSPLIEHNKDHVNFVNFNWGPTNNPYAKYMRPARLFVFIGDHPVRGEDFYSTKDNYYLAPIIHNSDDGNYYIFEKGSASPLLLDNWMNLIKKQAPKNETIRINICEDYATGPDDVCGQVPYESEAHYVHDDYVAEDFRNNKRPRLSAARSFKQDWHHVANLFSGEKSMRADISIEDTSIAWNDTTERDKILKNVAMWSDYPTIKSIFEYIRDLRYFTDYMDKDFKRRITWLMADDGCWSRASAFIKDFFGAIDNPVATYHRPSKIYAFGNLCVNSKNARDGFVTWWFHVAPIIRDKQTDQVYVLDPSVEAKKPIPVNDWIARIADNTGECAFEPHTVEKINICNGYGLAPWRGCESTPQSEESYGMLEQMLYMKYESGIQKSLGNDPRKTLGDSPPWLTE